MIPPNQFLSRLTIVIPTYERHDFVLRLMNYWAENSGPTVIILDGSSKCIPEIILNKYPPSIRYYHMPGKTLHDRLLSSLEKVDTEFVLRGGDDEFYIPSALSKCINELDHDHEQVACCGRALGFFWNGNLACGVEQYPKLKDYVISNQLAEDRLVKHMSHYVPSLVYAVCRSAVWKKCYEFVLQKNYPFFASRELQFEMIMSFAGKSKVIPELMWLRSHGESQPIRNTDPSLDPSVSLLEWWFGLADEHQRLDFVSLMTTAFSEISTGEDQMLENSVVAVKGVEAYLAQHKICKRQFSKSVCFVSMVSIFLGKRAAKNLYKFLKFVYKKINYNMAPPLRNSAKTLEKSGVNIDYVGLDNIIFSIDKFYKHRTPT